MESPRSRLSIGPSDFRALREPGVLYVDKTDLVREVIEDPAQVLLLPRPRRFGKTTNLSTLRHFLGKSAEDLSPLFADLAVWRSAPARAHFQRYPLLYLTFKDVKKGTWPDCLDGVAGLLADLHHEHRYLLDEGVLTREEAEPFTAILHRRAAPAQYEESLRKLCRHLSLHHGQKVVILVDEYDTPLHAAFGAGYYEQAIGFFRGFLSGGLKDNEYLFKAVLTGILRVAKESIFSGLNNISAHSLLSRKFATAFGFTEPEVSYLAERSGFTGSLEDLRAWYNGYLFGGEVVYNPWSVLSALTGATDFLLPYWVNTSSNDLIHDLLMRLPGGEGEDLERLLRGEGIRKRIVESTVLRDIRLDADALWSFLLFSGYLKAAEVRQEGATITAELRIPNREVRSVFEDLFRTWLRRGLGGEREVEELTRAILAGDVEGVELRLGRLLVESASFLDAAGHPVKMPPEAVYHAFVLGLLVHLQPRYLVRSNRESGHGRYDLMVLPREAGQPGAVLELKVKRRGETLRQALGAAQRQLRERDYAAELRAQGATPIQQLALAFDGKKVLVGRAGG